MGKNRGQRRYENSWVREKVWWLVWEYGVSALISLLLAWGDAGPLHLLGILQECGVSALIRFLLAWCDAAPPPPFLVGDTPRMWSVGVNQFAAGLRWCWSPSLVGDTPRMWSVGVNQFSAGLRWCWAPPYLLGILPECGVSALISLLLAWGDAGPLHLLGILPECGLSA